jgi:hypothetical protein
MQRVYIVKKSNIKVFMKCVSFGRKPSICFDSITQDIQKDMNDGFIEEIDQSYRMVRKTVDDDELTTKEVRRWVPTDLGLQFLRFKLL